MAKYYSIFSPNAIQYSLRGQVLRPRIITFCIVFNLGYKGLLFAIRQISNRDPALPELDSNALSMLMFLIWAPTVIKLFLTIVFTDTILSVQITKSVCTAVTSTTTASCSAKLPADIARSESISPIVVARSPSTTLIRCDNVYEYTAEAYNWKRTMEARNWVGCQVQ